MLYFTRAWANGEFDDEAADRVAKGYHDRLATLAPRMPQALRTLALDVQVHDAIIDQVRWHPAAGELTLTLATLTDEGEYRAVRLTYRGALLGEQRLETLRAAAWDRRTMILEQEVDTDNEEGLLIHRLLFWPHHELTIDFSELVVAIEPRSDRRVKLDPAFLEIHEDAPA